MPLAIEIIGTGETFTTIASWEAALDAAHPHRGECKAEVFSSVMFSGAVYTATNFPTLTSVDGAEHDGRAHEVSGVGNARIEFVGASTIINMRDPYIRISWLEIKGPGNNLNGDINCDDPNITVHHCIIHNNQAIDNAAQRGIELDDPGGEQKAYRNIIYGTGGPGLRVARGTAGSVVLLNTVYECLDDGIENAASAVDYAIEANAIFENTDSDIFGTDGTLSNNATSDATATEGTNNLINQVAADTFVAATTNFALTDLLLKAGANLINAAESTYSPATYPEIDKSISDRTTEITGTWDIGASQFPVPPPTSINMDTLSGTFSVESLVVIPGEASISISSATGTFAAESLVVTPGEVLMAIDLLSGTLAAESITWSGAVSLAMDKLASTLSVEALTVTPGTVTMSMNLLAGTLVADALVVTPGAVTITPNLLGLTGAVESLTVIPGAVTISMDPLSLIGTLPALIVSNVAVIQMDTLGASLSAGALVVAPGEASISMSVSAAVFTAESLVVTPGGVITALDTTSLSGAALFLDVQPGEYVASMDTLAGTLVSKAIVVEPGAVSIDIDLLVGAVVAKALTVSPGAVSTALDLLTTNLTIESLTVVPGEATTTMSTIAGTLAANSVTVVPGEVTIALDSTAITLAPLGLVLIPGEVLIAMNTVIAATSALSVIVYIPFSGIDTTITSTTVIRTLISGTTLYTIVDK